MWKIELVLTGKLKLTRKQVMVRLPLVAAYIWFTWVHRRYFML